MASTALDPVLTAPTIGGLTPIKPDPLLALIALCNDDPRPDKIDVGVGVYRDAAGGTPIPRSVKLAEQRLWQQQDTKSYMGGRGDMGFVARLRPIVLGRHAGDARIDGLQTPGGCGALSLAFKLIAKANPAARVLVGTPTWPNHIPVIETAGLEIATHKFYDVATQSICFDEMLVALDAGRPGDVALLHGCCHNPTGADLDNGQWDRVVEVVARRALLPMVDFAYQGLGRGLDEDAYGVWAVLDACGEALVAQSCDKNFGSYRDRVGSLFVKTATKDQSSAAIGHCAQIAREMWSMPPDHGAAVVRVLLEDAALAADWRVEVGEMRDRINSVRGRIAASDPRLAYVAGQYGMFSMLPLTPEKVRSLRERESIYMADSGRFNVVGMSDASLDRFIAAVVAAL